MTARQFTCPEEALAGELELAVTYVVACNREELNELLLSRRADFARSVAWMIAERAGHGLSGMTLAEDDTPAKELDQPDMA